MKKIKIIRSRPLKEEEEVVDQQPQDVAPEQPAITFESNPLEFILQKYPTLTKTLVELLTEDFRDYITGVYIMAPKPTTFKIVLHNNRYFHLMFMGNDNYEAKVSGKKYWLAKLGELELATLAIADLLTLGTPPSVEGPSEELPAASGKEETPEETSTKEIPTEEEGGVPELKESVKRFKLNLLENLDEAYTDFPKSAKEINDADVKKLFKAITSYSDIEGPLALDPKNPKSVKITRKLQRDPKFLPYISKMLGVKATENGFKLGSINVGFGEGSKGGRGVQSKGLGFEGDLANDLEEFNQNGFKNKDSFKYLGLVEQIVKELKLTPGSFEVKSEGGKNQSRPLTMGDNGPEIAFSGKSLAATLTDITIVKGGKEYFLSLKYGNTLTFFNAGVTKVLPADEIKKGQITNSNGKQLLSTFGINNKTFCEVFNKYPKGDFSSKNGPTSKYDAAALQNLIQSGIGSGYYMVWGSGSDYKFYKIDEKYLAKASQIQGGVNVYYGGLDGKGKRVDVTFESPLYKFKINIRNKQGGLYPSHIMCDYVKK
jgi:hypothetical protein